MKINQKPENMKCVTSIPQAVDLVNSTRKVVLLMSGSIGEELVAAIQGNPKIYSMTVFTSKVSLYKAWAVEKSNENYKIEVFDRFGQPMMNNLQAYVEDTLEEVGRIFKVTRERVRQIEAKAVRKLQHPVRSRQLKGFLDGLLTNTTN